jgi:hypothetical protein
MTRLVPVARIKNQERTLHKREELWFVTPVSEPARPVDWKVGVTAVEEEPPGDIKRALGAGTGSAKLWRAGLAGFADHEWARLDTKKEEWRTGVARFFLSRGERAGVRAGHGKHHTPDKH